MIFFLTSRHVISCQHCVSWSLLLVDISTWNTIMSWARCLGIVSVKTSHGDTCRHGIASRWHSVGDTGTDHRWQGVGAWRRISILCKLSQWINKKGFTLSSTLSATLCRSLTYSFCIWFLQTWSMMGFASLPGSKCVWTQGHRFQGQVCWREQAPCVGRKGSNEACHHGHDVW